MFRIGQKVLCVDAARPNFLGGVDNGLIKGRIYTVSGVGVTNVLDPKKRPCIYVAELRLTQPVWQHRFRPIVERKTDIGIFVKMLNPQKHTELT